MLNPPFLPNYVRCGRWQGVRAHGKTFWYPIWLSYACGVLEQDNHELRLVDAVDRKWKHENAIEDIKQFNPDLVVVDTNFTSLINDINLCKEIKKSVSACKIVVVGPPIAQFSNLALESEGVDVAARLEYDYTLRDLASALEHGGCFQGIKGISYKTNGEIVHNPDREFISSEELDTIPFVSGIYKKHLKISDYYLDHTLHPMVQIFSGRGCPSKCTFCSWPKNLMGNKYRARSVKNIVDELEWIKKNLPEVKEIFFEDDTFTISNKYINAIAEEILKQKLNIVWSCNARATLDYSTMRKMKEAGCRLLVVGYESGNDEILKNIKKGITTTQSIRFADDARKAKLLVLGDFIFGLPGETRRTIEKTKTFIKKYIRPDFLQVAVASPIPGTEFYNWTKENDFLLTDDVSGSIDEDGFQKCIVAYPGLSSEDIWRYTFNAKKQYYLSIRYLCLLFRRVFARHGFHEMKMFIASAVNYLRYMINKGQA